MITVDDILISQPLPHTDAEIVHCMARNENIQRAYPGTNLAEDAHAANRELRREAALRAARQTGDGPQYREAEREVERMDEPETEFDDDSSLDDITEDSE